MIIERKTMNILFYLGIIVPTIITVILFVLFIVCWYRFKARRQVLQKKHDPHGKMRQMGMARPPPPPPPVFVHEQFHRINFAGMDNDAYTVSRSPSTEQEQGPRQGLYHVPHDSGLSDLSEMTQCKDRPHSQASQGSTDSEDSGFRSSRSGQYHPNNTNNQLQDIPLLRPIKSNKQGAETVQLSPTDTANWQARTCAQTFNSSSRTLNSSVRNLNSSQRNFNSSGRKMNTPERNLNCAVNTVNSSSRNLNSCRQMNPSASFNGNEPVTRKADLNDISTHISWMYLQNLASSSTGLTNCTDTRPAVTTAQIHSSNPAAGALVESSGDLMGYSVV